MKYLIFDVDGTVTESCQVVNSQMAKLLNKIGKKHRLVFISGTDVKELERMVGNVLNVSYILLGNSGTHAVMYNYGLVNELWKMKLTPKHKKEIRQAINQLKSKFNLKPLTNIKDQILDRDTQITLSILGRNAPADIKADYDKDRVKRITYVRFLKLLLPEYEMTIGGTTSIDITVKNIDKAFGVSKFMDEFNVNKKDATFFGDQLQKGGNDYPVISTGIKCVGVKNPKETIAKLRWMFLII